MNSAIFYQRILQSKNIDNSRRQRHLIYGVCKNIYNGEANISRDRVFLSCFSNTGIPIIPASKLIIFFRTSRKGNSIAYFCNNCTACHLSTIRIKSDCTGIRFFLLIMRFQYHIIRDSIFFPSLSDTGISIIPAGKLIIFLRTVRKCNSIAYFSCNVSTFHLPTVCVKGDCRFRLFPCGIIRGIFLRN